MNSKEFTKALDLLEEHGIDKEYLYEAMTLALTSAYKKNTGLSNVRVEVDKEKNEFKLFSFKKYYLIKIIKNHLMKIIYQ